jgi:hypothetical protein
MWFMSSREQKKISYIVGGMTAEQRREVLHAAATGKAPADAGLRPAAVVLVQRRLAEYASSRTFALTVFAVFFLLSLAFAFTDSSWYLLGAVAFAACGVWAIRYPSALRRRIAALDLAR